METSLTGKTKTLPQMLRAFGFLIWNFARIDQVYMEFNHAFQSEFKKLNPQAYVTSSI